jgi:MoxR-like ATPase
MPDLEHFGAQTGGDFDQARATYETLYGELNASTYMTPDHLRFVIAAVATGGKLLLAGPYGTGKTTTAKALASMVGGTSSRLQGGEETRMSDMTGYYRFNRVTGEEDFVPGAVFANVPFVDELHRVPGKPQAGYVEAMEEGQVTVEGHTHELPKPQVFIATINPDAEETVKPVLLDRFTGSITLPKQDAETRRKVLAKKRQGHVTKSGLVSMEGEVTNLRAVVESERITLHEQIEEVANTIIDAVYAQPDVDHEDSVEGTFRHYLNILNVARYAALAGASAENGKESSIVTKGDVAFAVRFVMPHRIVPKMQAQSKGVSSEDIVERAISRALSAPAIVPAR